MPRQFTALEIPASVREGLAIHRGGVPSARWIDPSNYHVTLRFIGDVDHGMARDVMAILGEARSRAPVAVTFDGLSTFGGGRPRALIARIVPTPELSRLQAEQERLLRRLGLDPETRKFTPHVTLARFRDADPRDLAGHLAMRGRFAPLTFTADRFVVYSARDQVGGGPYVVEAIYPFGRTALAEPSPERAEVPRLSSSFG